MLAKFILHLDICRLLGKVQSGIRVNLLDSNHRRAAATNFAIKYHRVPD